MAASRINAKKPPRINEIQEIINKDLRARISVKDFKSEFIATRVKNTANVKCKKCNSDNVFVEEKQLRSSDEAATKLYECLNCGNRWRVD
jgi:DNA-directed RNA polymerase subunit M/transcription elongation factor TFIIS